MRAPRALIVTLAVAGCATGPRADSTASAPGSAPPAATAPPAGTAPALATRDGIPVISLRGTGARPRAAVRHRTDVRVVSGEEWPHPDPGDPPWQRELRDELERTPRGPADAGDAAAEPAPIASPAEPGARLPVIVGDVRHFDVLVEARRQDGRLRATFEVADGTGQAWSAVELELELLAGRQPRRRRTVRVADVRARERAAASLEEGVELDDADRVRVSVVRAEPLPGEQDVPVRPGHLRGLEVVQARLLRTRDHELDAILDLDGEPMGPWRHARLEVVFLDRRGEAITRGTAQLWRRRGPPWARLHVVGAERAPEQQVAEVEVRCTGVW